MGDHGAVLVDLQEAVTAGGSCGLIGDGARRERIDGSDRPPLTARVAAYARLGSGRCLSQCGSTSKWNSS